MREEEVKNKVIKYFKKLKYKTYSDVYCVSDKIRRKKKGNCEKNYYFISDIFVKDRKKTIAIECKGGNKYYPGTGELYCAFGQSLHAKRYANKVFVAMPYESFLLQNDIVCSMKKNGIGIILVKNNVVKVHSVPLLNKSPEVSDWRLFLSG